MNSDQSLTCFKAYDVRGKLGKDLNEEIGLIIINSMSSAFSGSRAAPKLVALERGLNYLKTYIYTVF